MTEDQKRTVRNLFMPETASNGTDDGKPSTTHHTFEIDTLEEMSIMYGYNPKTLDIDTLRIRRPYIEIHGDKAVCYSYDVERLMGEGSIFHLGPVDIHDMYDTEEGAVAAAVPDLISQMEDAFAKYRMIRKRLRAWRRRYPNVEQLDAFVDTEDSNG